MTDDVGDSLRLAGFALAHAAWSIEDGGTLCTLAMVEGAGERELVRYEAETIAESIDIAHQDLRDRIQGGGVAALVFDGYATPEAGERSDALMIEILGPQARPLGVIVQPYRAAHRSRIPFVRRASGFAILGEPIVAREIDVEDAERLILQGARDHPLAGRLFPG